LVLYKGFKIFEKQINDTPLLKKAFKALKEKVINDPKYKEKVHPDFVNGLMMLSFDEDIK
jgi:hypothetical protein